MSEYGKFGPLIGAIDEGTSSARFIIFKANSSEVVAYHQKELEQHFPQEGWVEQDPCAILEVVTTCIQKAVEKLVSSGGSAKVFYNLAFFEYPRAEKKSILRAVTRILMFNTELMIPD